MRQVVTACDGPWHSHAMSWSTELPSRPCRVAIVGGGASGALVATNLLRAGRRGARGRGDRAAGRAGLGVAYSTRDPWHRLNVPVIVDERVRRRTGPLPALVRRHRRRSPAAWTTAATSRRCSPRPSPTSGRRCVTSRDAAERIEAAGTASASRSPPATAIAADAVVLATGLETPVQPRLPAGAGRRPAGRRRPVGGGRPRHHPATATTVAIIGTSLTAIDLAGSILNRHPRATVVALSRHGQPAAVARGPVAPATARARLHRRRVPGVRPRWPTRRRASAPSATTGPAPSTRCGPSSRRCGWRWATTCGASSWTTTATTGRSAATGSPPRSRATSTHGSRVGGWPFTAAAIRAVETAAERLRISAAARSPPPRGTADRIVVAIGPNADATANPLLGAGDRGRLVAPGADGDRDRRRPDDRPGHRRGRRPSGPSTRWERCAKGSCGRRSRCPRSASRPPRRSPAGSCVAGAA